MYAVPAEARNGSRPPGTGVSVVALWLLGPRLWFFPVFLFCHFRQGLSLILLLTDKPTGSSCDFCPILRLQVNALPPSVHKSATEQTQALGLTDKSAYISRVPEILLIDKITLQNPDVKVGKHRLNH